MSAFASSDRQLGTLINVRSGPLLPILRFQSVVCFGLISVIRRLNKVYSLMFPNNPIPRERNGPTSSGDTIRSCTRRSADCSMVRQMMR